MSKEQRNVFCPSKSGLVQLNTISLARRLTMYNSLVWRFETILYVLMSQNLNSKVHSHEGAYSLVTSHYLGFLVKQDKTYYKYWEIQIVLRRYKCSDTNRNRLEKVGILPIRMVKSNVSSPVVLFVREKHEHDSLWRRAYARNVRLYYPYRQYTNLFLFR